MTPDGFPHSEISGSQVVCASPELIAAYHVLHRLLAPRHPPCALSSLTGKTRLSLVLGESVMRSLAIRESEDPKIENGRVPDSLSSVVKDQTRETLLGRVPRTMFEVHLVEITGIEPVTSGLQSRRSPS
jgi:hypothetical protein